MSTNSNPTGPDKNPSHERPDVLPTLFSDGYGTYQVRPTNFLISFALHTLALGVILYSGIWVAQHKTEIRQQVISIVAPELSPYLAEMPHSKTQVGGGGGGGDRDKLEAPKGGLPKSSMEQITPPMVVRRNDNPKLAVEPTVIVPPTITLPRSDQLGDPMSKIAGVLSNGTGYGGGIGSGSGGGVGSGHGPGVGPGNGGGIGGGNFRWGGGLVPPKALFSPDPEYSEEARKSRMQGTVILALVVGIDGRATNIHVQRSLGFGLDEKAVEAVRRWKFEPAKNNGQPFAAPVAVEVNFTLY